MPTRAGMPWALLVLGIILAFSTDVPIAWSVFCIAFGMGVILLGTGNSIAIWIGIACIVTSAVALVFALTSSGSESERALPLSLLLIVS